MTAVSVEGTKATPHKIQAAIKKMTISQPAPDPTYFVAGAGCMIRVIPQLNSTQITAHITPLTNAPKKTSDAKLRRPNQRLKMKNSNTTAHANSEDKKSNGFIET